jgi:hypothetical protein
MRKKPERIAWTVLWIAFAACWILAIGGPLGVRSYLRNARESQEAQLQVIGGTILVQKAKGSDPIGVIQATTLAQGDQVITDATSSATLDLFERSRLILYSNTNLILERMQTPRFEVSERPDEIHLNLTGGLVRVGVALPPPGERAIDFQVLTPHTDISLQEGSYRIEVTNEGTQVTVVMGQALVGRGSSQIILVQGTRSQVGLDGAPSTPMSAVQNLLVNGNFQEPLDPVWVTSTVVLTTSVKPPAIEQVENGGRTAVRFARRESDNGNHTEAAIQQPLDYDVRDFVRLEVLLDLRLDFQSLSGGGLQSSEFPIIVRLDYKDIGGKDMFWTHGFYYQNQAGYPIAPDPWGRLSGQQIPKDVWFPYESGNLLVLLGDNKPTHITGLTIYASGWNYDSLVAEVQLLVE